VSSGGGCIPLIVSSMMAIMCRFKMWTGCVEVVGQSLEATFEYWGETSKFGKLQLSVTNDAFNLAPALESSRRRT
jgi:hypothetical protein